MLVKPGQPHRFDRREDLTSTRVGNQNSALVSVLQQAHQHPMLVILSPEEHGHHLNVSLLSAWTKPIHRPIQSQVAKARQQIVVTVSAEASGGQPFGDIDDRFDAHLGVPIGFSR